MILTFSSFKSLSDFYTFGVSIIITSLPDSSIFTDSTLSIFRCYAPSAPSLFVSILKSEFFLLSELCFFVVSISTLSDEEILGVSLVWLLWIVPRPSSILFEELLFLLLSPFKASSFVSCAEPGRFPPLPLALAILLLLSLFVVRSSCSSAASSSAITCLMECMGIGRLLMIKAPSLYMHWALSSVVSDRLMAASPRRLLLPCMPETVPLLPGAAPNPVPEFALPTFTTLPAAPIIILRWFYDLKWLVSVVLTACEDEAPKPPPAVYSVALVFLLSRSVVLSAIDLIYESLIWLLNFISWLSACVFCAAFASMTTLACGKVD